MIGYQSIHPPDRAQKISIIYMLICCFFYAIVTCAARSLGDTINIFTVVFYRNSFSLILLLPYILSQNKGRIPFEQFNKLNLIRGAGGWVGMCLWFAALMYMPVSESVSLSFTTPLFVALLAVLFLKERIGVLKISTLLLGFIGTLIILAPDKQAFNYFSIFALLSSLIWAVNNILVKNLTYEQDASLIVFFMLMITSILSIPFLLLDLRLPNANEIALIIIMSVSSNLAQILVAKAYQNSDVTLIIPFDFMRLVFASLMAFFIFDERVTMHVIVGSLLIIMSSMVLAKKELYG